MNRALWLQETASSPTPLSLLQGCASSGAEALANQLHSLPYLGSSYGSSTSARILVVGDQSAANLTSYLSNAFNATYVNLGTNPDLRSRAIFRPSQRSSGCLPPAKPSPRRLSHAQPLVRYGGELVTTDPALDNLSALRPSQSPTPPRYLPSTVRHPQAALVHTQYTNSSFQETVTNTTLTARDAAAHLRECVGLGKVVFVGFGRSSVPQTNDQSVVVSNIISDATGIKSPLWYGSTDPSVFDGGV